LADLDALPLRILLMPAPPLEVLTDLLGPDLPPRVGALLLFVVGAGAIVGKCVVNEGGLGWRGRSWVMEIWAGLEWNFSTFGRGFVRHTAVAVRERDALESTSSKRK
jgi:hypothetical protein